MTYKYFITEEWNESDQLPHGGRTSHVDALGLCSVKDINETKKWMEAYSPFDYIDTMEYDTKDEYENMLTTLEGLGAKINRKES